MCNGKKGMIIKGIIADHISQVYVWSVNWKEFANINLNNYYQSRNIKQHEQKARKKNLLTQKLDTVMPPHSGVTVLYKKKCKF